MSKSLLGAFLAGAAVGCLGGLIGLGGAEFRLPLLISVFGFVASEAVILNKAASLIVVAAGLIFRSHAVPWAEVAGHWRTVLNLLVGSLAGAWVGADFATRIGGRSLYKVIAVLLVAIAAVLALGHAVTDGEPLLTGWLQIVAGVVAGMTIGAVAAFLGVAGGELLIPTLVLLFGIEIKLAGSLSLAVSLPTMLVAFARYSRDQSFGVLRRNGAFLVAMAVGSITGTFAGAMLLGVVSASALVPMLVVILLLSAAKVWCHR